MNLLDHNYIYVTVFSEEEIKNHPDWTPTENKYEYFAYKHKNGYGITQWAGTPLGQTVKVNRLRDDFLNESGAFWVTDNYQSIYEGMIKEVHLKKDSPELYV